MNPKQKTITIDFMRHGESTSNVAENSHTLSGLWYVLATHDPGLSPKGIADAQKLSRSLPTPDLVFTSPLRRAIQTAENIWPKKTAFIAPYLRELGPWVQNKPLRKTTSEEAGNLPQFLNWLRHFLKTNHYNHVKHIVVVTHANLMQRDLHLQHKPNNNQIFRIQFPL